MRGPTRRPAWLAGLVAPIVYGVGVVVGGAITPGYSHLGNMISELTMTRTAARVPLAVIFVFYNLLLAAFAWSLPGAVPALQTRPLSIGAVFLGLVATAGIGMSTYFPTDRPGDPLSAVGWVHVGLATIASAGSMAAIFALAWAARRAPRWQKFQEFSFACLGVIAASGVWAATTAATLSPLMGLAERVTIGTFMIWLFAFAFVLARRSGETHARRA